MRHLVLGSEGLIGGYLVDFLKKNDEEVIEFDIVRTDEEDLRTFENRLLHERMKQSDMVYFLAFDVGGAEYLRKYQDTYQFISNNIKIMDVVFDALKRYGTPFIFVSSQMASMLHSTYGLLKLIGERYANTLNGIVVKCWNVYGYEQDSEKAHVITDFIKMAKNEGKIAMKTDGQEERQFLFGEDCAECLYILAKKYRDIDRNKRLHITSFRWNKIIDVARIISKEFNDCPFYPSKKKDTVHRNIKTQPDDYILNFWNPKTELLQGIQKIIQQV